MVYSSGPENRQSRKGLVSSNLATSADNQLVMLGFEREEPFIVKGIYAERLREALRRKHENDPNEEDIKAKERSEQIKSEYRAIWK